MQDFITVYHATDKDIPEIGVEKKTMFFTGSWDLAKDWGDEHYPDGYHILEVDLPLEDISEFVPERDKFQDFDFEQLEWNPGKMPTKVVYWDCNEGYMIRDINDYKVR